MNCICSLWHHILYEFEFNTTKYCKSGPFGFEDNQEGLQQMLFPITHTLKKNASNRVIRYKIIHRG